MEEVLLSVMYEIPSDPNAEKVQITRETVLEKVYPTIVSRREISGRRARHHRDSA
jgi:ATP-dependent Clp protease ATP-binding subunit ClpX